MKLVNVSLIKTQGSGKLLSGLNVVLRRPHELETQAFRPICLIGPNGTGKSQFLQTVAELIQAAWHQVAPNQELCSIDAVTEFKMSYLLSPEGGGDPIEVELARSRDIDGGLGPILLSKRPKGEGWGPHQSLGAGDEAWLPSRVVAYTSGENETLSLPFLASRIEFAEALAGRAIPGYRGREVDADADETPEPRLMLVDYGTHLEVLVANLLLGSKAQRRHLLDLVNLKDLRSVRCIIQLNHKPVKNGVRKRPNSKRKGVQLTQEMEDIIDRLLACATTWDYDSASETYIFDYWIDDACREAFGYHFKDAWELYRALHKLGLLNDLAISRPARQRFQTDLQERHFASRLPEPPEQDRVFRFEHVTFVPDLPVNTKESRFVDYVSLSDGEHQLLQVLGMFAMVSEQNVLFLLDEPESHSNPQWRIEFMSRIAALPTTKGVRAQDETVASQDAIITTHAPFIPSDLPREQVVIFKRSSDDAEETPKIQAMRPNIETFGASYQEILAECFSVYPPISQQPRQFIDKLLKSDDVEAIENGLSRLGPSIETVKLEDHLDELKQD